MEEGTLDPRGDESDMPEETPPGSTAHTVDAAAALLVDQGWQPPADPMELDAGIKWRFHLINPDQRSVLHIHLAEVLRSHIIKRLQAAADAEYQVHLALPLEALFVPEVQAVLARVNAWVHVLRDGSVDEEMHHLDAFANLRVAIQPRLRTEIGQMAWKRRRNGTNQEKGRFLESLLSFLFEQDPDFTVIERNYRGDSDEVDIWLQIDNWSRRAWQEDGVPFLLVEAKNRAEKAGAPFVLHIKSQLREKRRRTRIGILCSTSPFTNDADIEVVKLAESEFAVVLLGPSELEAWIAASDHSEYLEGQVRRAMIR